MPSTLGRLRLTGKTVPPKGLLMRFHRIVRPTLPTFSVAPITATFCGAKKGANDARVNWRISLLGSPLAGRVVLCITVSSLSV
jgi:hypothetical protein